MWELRGVPLKCNFYVYINKQKKIFFSSHSLEMILQSMEMEDKVERQTKQAGESQSPERKTVYNEIPEAAFLEFPTDKCSWDI